MHIPPRNRAAAGVHVAPARHARDGSSGEQQGVGRSIIGDALAIEPRWSLWSDPEL